MLTHDGAPLVLLALMSQRHSGLQGRQHISRRLSRGHCGVGPILVGIRPLPLIVAFSLQIVYDMLGIYKAQDEQDAEHPSGSGTSQNGDQRRVHPASLPEARRLPTVIGSTARRDGRNGMSKLISRNTGQRLRIRLPGRCHGPGVRRISQQRLHFR